MSAVRCEFVVMGTSTTDGVGIGVIKEVVSVITKTGLTTDPVEADWLTVPPRATHCILMGITGKTLVAWHPTLPVITLGKRILEFSDGPVIKVTPGMKMSFKESTT